MENVSLINPFGDDNDITPVGLYRVGKRTAQEATWECTACGVVLPYRVKSGLLKGRWLRGKCACQIEEARIKDEDELREVRERNAVTSTYGWLGSKYSDLDLAKKTFDTFRAEIQPEAFEMAYDFADKLKGNLILHSETFGTGKTHLLAAICNQLRARRIASHFVTAPKLFRAIQDRMQNDEPYADIIFKAVTVPFLVIDDVDKVKASDWKEERYFEIIDERTKAGKPTGISTNKYEKEELAKYMGGAACSRLKIGRIVVEMQPNDYREKL